MSELPELHDERTRRCPRLGHEVSFRYCRAQEGATLCPRLLDCWWETFDVRAFVEEHLGQAAARGLSQHAPGGKILSILDIVEQVRQQAAADDAEG